MAERAEVIGGIAAQKRMPPKIAFPVLAFALFAYFFAASAPSPAFVVLQHQWHFSASLLTVAFGVYAIALLLTLMLVGSISDYIGRRPVIFVALIIQAVSMVMFVLADNINNLIGARIVQGIATGIANGALAAAVVEAAPDSMKKLGALISSISPLAGLAAGALVSGAVLKLVVNPMPLMFGTLSLLFALGALLTLLTPEYVAKRPGALASISLRVSVPTNAKTEFIRAVPVLITTWAMGGLYLALIPSVILEVFNFDNGILNGLAIATLSGVGAVAPSLLKRYELPKANMIGLANILLGLILIEISLLTGSLVLFFLATALSGIGFGGSFSAVIQTLAPLVPKEERAQLFTVIFVVSYLALSVPAMLAGKLVHTLGLKLTVEGYIVLLIMTGIIGLVLQSRSLRDSRLRGRSKVI